MKPRMIFPGMRAAVMMAVWIGTAPVWAQAIFTLPQAWTNATAPLPSPGSTGVSRFSYSNITSAFPLRPPPFRLGPVVGHFSVAYLISYNEGLFSAGRSIDSSVQTLSLGASLDLSEHWSADYTHTRSYFSSNELFPTADNTASLSGRYRLQDWAWGVSANYLFDSPNLSDTGGQTRRKLISYGLNASGMLGERTMLGATLGYSSRSANVPSLSAAQWTVADYQSWSALQNLSYLISRKFDAGLSVGETIDIVDPGEDLRSYTAQAQLNWRPTARIQLNASIGTQYWRFQKSGSDTDANLVYNATGNYMATRTTTLTVGANQAISPSYFSNQAVKSTSTSIGIEQRLLGKLFATVRGQQFRTAYFAATDGLPSRRIDKGSQFSSELRAPVLGIGSVGIFYSEGRNTSNDSQFNFAKSRRYGGEASIRF